MRYAAKGALNELGLDMRKKQIAISAAAALGLFVLGQSASVGVAAQIGAGTINSQADGKSTFILIGH